MKPENEYLTKNIKWVMDLPGGMYAVHLLTKKVIFRETVKLNLQMPFYDIVCSMDDTEYYSLRASDGHAHVMFAVKDGAVQMCRGMNKSRPANYMRQIVSFIIGRGWDVAADMACTGIIRQKDRYYNVYDLPKNFNFWGNMDLSYADLRYLPNMKSATIHGNYDISGNFLLGFSGVPSIIDGDFIMQNMKNPALIGQKPRFTIVRGKYITR